MTRTAPSMQAASRASDAAEVVSLRNHCQDSLSKVYVEASQQYLSNKLKIQSGKNTSFPRQESFQRGPISWDRERGKVEGVSSISSIFHMGSFY